MCMYTCHLSGAKVSRGQTVECHEDQSENVGKLLKDFEQETV